MARVSVILLRLEGSLLGLGPSLRSGLSAASAASAASVASAATGWPRGGEWERIEKGKGTNRIRCEFGGWAKSRV